MGTAGVQVGWTLWDPEYVTQNSLKYHLPTERKRGQQGIMYYGQFVVCVRSVPGNTGLSFLSFFFPVFGKLPMCVPIILIQLYLKYDVF